MRPTVKVTFGGVPRELRIPIGVAVAIEEKTGLGTIALARDLYEQRGKFSHAVAVIAAALEENGINLTQAELMEAAGRDGLVETNTTACRVMNALFAKPESAEGNGRKGKTPATTSP